MTTAWQVHEAKSRLSELMDRAIKEGPQVITRHGKPVVRVIAAETGTSAAAGGSHDGFLEFLLSIPKTGLDEGLPGMPRLSRRKSPFEDD